MDNNVVNLSQHILTVDELNLLSTGIHYCPTLLDHEPGELKTDLDLFYRRLRLTARLQNETTDISDLLTIEKQNHSLYAFESKYS